MLLEGEIAGRERKAGEGENKQRGNSQVLPPISPVLAPSRDGAGVYRGLPGCCPDERQLQAPGPTGHSLLLQQKNIRKETDPPCAELEVSGDALIYLIQGLDPINIL